MYFDGEEFSYNFDEYCDFVKDALFCYNTVGGSWSESVVAEGYAWFLELMTRPKSNLVTAIGEWLGGTFIAFFSFCILFPIILVGNIVVRGFYILASALCGILSLPTYIKFENSR